MNATSRRKASKSRITAQEFDERFERGQDIAPFLDFKKATVVKRVNVDFPSWMVDRLDQEAQTLNVSRQAVIKMWIYDHFLTPHSLQESARK